ncbi:hypothetical protein D3C85_1687240 [compost metagenome]
MGDVDRDGLGHLGLFHDADERDGSDRPDRAHGAWTQVLGSPARPADSALEPLCGQGGLRDRPGHADERRRAGVDGGRGVAGGADQACRGADGCL